MILASLVSVAVVAAGTDIAAAAEAIAQGDAHYARRAEGARDGTALPAEAEAAIAAYRRALALDATSYPARLRMLRAIFFRGGFYDMDQVQQIKLFEEAKKLAEDTVKRLEAKMPAGASRREKRLAALRREPVAAEIYLWAAISWGQWAVTHKLAAAWQGAAGQIRDLSQAVIDIEPTTLYGGGYLILGRLHAEAPRIPLLTSWISRERAIECLRQAIALAPQSTANMYFLADALLELQPTRKEEARALLQRCATVSPRPEFLVEDAHYAAMARERLAGIR